MKPFIDPKHPFFQKTWARWLSFLVPFVWIFIELAYDELGWAFLMAAMASYAFWVLIWNWKDPSSGP